MKTRAELIQGLSLLQMARLESWVVYPLLSKRYWHYHDPNCKLSTYALKDRIRRELIWKLQMEGKRHGTTTKI